MNLEAHIRSIPDFPKKGIMFRDITTLLKNRDAFADAVEQLAAKYRDMHVDKVVCVESRGFILGGALALRLGAGFVPVRKPKKLPGQVEQQEYQLEYGTDMIEIHKDSILPGERVLLHDDLLATGGTIEAACTLVEKLGGSIVGLSFLIELSFLEPRKKLRDRDIFSLITYHSEE
jgi:adenine phosphoribosyltransferase